MLKYTYTLKDKNYKIFSQCGDNKDLEQYLQRINGVYIRLAWVEQKNNETKERKEYLIHQKNGIITEYGQL